MMYLDLFKLYVPEYVTGDDVFIGESLQNMYTPNPITARVLTHEREQEAEVYKEFRQTEKSALIDREDELPLAERMIEINEKLSDLHMDVEWKLPRLLAPATDTLNHPVMQPRRKSQPLKL
ncbi:hypothetical protein Tco_1187205 [Tanacetum coccineum]